MLVRFHESLLLSSLSHIYKLQRRQAETLALEGEGAKSNEEGSGEKEEKSGDDGSSSNGENKKDNDSSSNNGDSAFEGKAVPICLFDKKKDPDEL